MFVLFAGVLAFASKWYKQRLDQRHRIATRSMRRIAKTLRAEMDEVRHIQNEQAISLRESHVKPVKDNQQKPLLSRSEDRYEADLKKVVTVNGRDQFTN